MVDFRMQAEKSVDGRNLVEDSLVFQLSTEIERGK